MPRDLQAQLIRDKKGRKEKMKRNPSWRCDKQAGVPSSASGTPVGGSCMVGKRKGRQSGQWDIHHLELGHRKPGEEPAHLHSRIDRLGHAASNKELSVLSKCLLAFKDAVLENVRLSATHLAVIWFGLCFVGCDDGSFETSDGKVPEARDNGNLRPGACRVTMIGLGLYIHTVFRAGEACLLGSHGCCTPP